MINNNNNRGLAPRTPPVATHRPVDETVKPSPPVAIPESRPNQASELARRSQLHPDDPLHSYKGQLHPLHNASFPTELVAPEKDLPLLHVRMVGERKFLPEDRPRYAYTCHM